MIFRGGDVIKQKFVSLFNQGRYLKISFRHLSRFHYKGSTFTIFWAESLPPVSWLNQVRLVRRNVFRLSSIFWLVLVSVLRFSCNYEYSMNGANPKQQLSCNVYNHIRQQIKAREKERSPTFEKNYLFYGISWLSFTKPYPVLLVVWLW